MLPQLDYSTYPSQIFWLVISFTVLYAFISYFVIPKIEIIFEKRSEIILINNRKAEENMLRIKSENEKYHSAIEKANILVQDIHRDNNLIMRDRKSEAYKKLSADIKEIRSNSDKSLHDFKDENEEKLVESAVSLTKLYYQEVLSGNDIDTHLSDDIVNGIRDEIKARI